MKRVIQLLSILLALAALTACPAPSGFNLPTTSDETAPGLPNANYSVRVMDSIGGSALEGAAVVVSDGTSTVASGTTGADGTYGFYFDPAKTYTITASMDDRASSKIQGVTDATKDGVVLYCHELGMISFPAVAPTIQSVQYSTDGSTYDDLTAGADAYDDTAWELLVTATAESAIEATAWSGFGMAAAFDRMPTGYTDSYETAALPSGYDELSESQPDGTFRSAAYWDFSDYRLPAGDHILYVVCYDVANNRVETRIPVTSDLAGAGADISAVAPSAFMVRTDVTPLSRNTFSAEPSAAGVYDGEAISYRAYITFNTSVSINGFNVLRSEDGADYDVAGTVQFGYAHPSGGFTYFETDPDLEIGKDYWYKVVGFNDTYSTAESTAIQTVFLPPHSAALSYPASYATVTTPSPDFRFVISDPSIISGQLADFYHVQLAIKEKAGSPMYRLTFAYDINGYYGEPGTVLYCDNETGSPVAYGSRELLSYENGVFTIHTAANGIALDTGVTYEWNIFGQGYATASGPTAAHFRRYNNGDVDGTYSYARSLADEPNHGYDTSNGWFTLTVSQDAE